jgi:hypothetical protein
MGRTTEYHCDTCGKKFGEMTHLNLKGGDLYESICGADTGILKRWQSRKITPGRCQGEYHFCNTACIKRWLDNLMNKVCL